MDVTSQILLKETDVPGARLTQDPKQCNVDVLKRWLECHGLKKSGKKDELVRRVEDALKLDLQVDPKEALPILWDKPILNQQVNHINLKLFFVNSSTAQCN